MKQDFLLGCVLKAPLKGRVKTRLMAHLGEEATLEAWKTLVAHLMDSLQSSQIIQQLHLYFDPPYAKRCLETWISSMRFTRPIHYTAQRVGHLGKRLQAAGEHLLSKSRKACLIGGDCPYLQARHFEESSQKLEDYDLVIGPAQDGGYYLLAFKHLYSSLFENIAWGSEEVLNSTLEQADKLQLQTHQLETLEDVDELDSWLAAQRFLRTYSKSG